MGEGDEPPRDLLGDGSLSLRIPAELHAAAAGWVSPIEDLAVVLPRGNASVEVTLRDGRRSPAPSAPPTMKSVYLDAWMDGEHAILSDPERRIGGTIDLRALRAELEVCREGDPSSLTHAVLSSALRMCAALLLGRQHLALVHAAAVVDGDGAAWLLPGDSHSGKTTTCLTLVRGGFDYLADDQVVLRRDTETGVVWGSGWPRRFTLDEGYTYGRPTGLRAAVDPRPFGPGRRVPSAPVAGLIFPRVDAGEPTRLEPALSADALARLIRHSPWLMADAAAVQPLLSLLQAAARLPAYQLRLGSDSFADPLRLKTHLPSAFKAARSGSPPRRRIA